MKQRIEDTELHNKVESILTLLWDICDTHVCHPKVCPMYELCDELYDGGFDKLKTVISKVL